MRDAIAGLLGLEPARRQRQGVDRQPVGRRGRGPVDLGPGRGHRGGRRVTGDPPPGHADRRAPPARAHRARPRPDLQLRAHGLRPRARRQLPVVPVRRPAGPLPALPRPARDLGHEPDRHRRQDHPRAPPRRGSATRRAGGPVRGPVRRRRRRPGHDPPGRPAARDRAHPADHRRSCPRCSSGATRTAPTTARSSSGSRRGRPTGGSPASTRTRCGSGSASRPTSTARTTSATSRCGRAPSPASRRGRPRSGRGGRAGTSSARR